MSRISTKRKNIFEKPFYWRQLPRLIKKWIVYGNRDAELGVQYLRNEIKDTVVIPDLQRQHAREVLDLYKWWCERKNRIDPLDFIDYDRTETDINEQYQLKQAIRHSAIEADQYDEDTNMLVRLMKVRPYLWT